MAGKTHPEPRLDKAKKNKMKTLLRELSDSEGENAVDSGSTAPADPLRPWRREFRAYLDILEQVPENMTSIAWWGVSNLLSCQASMLIHVSAVQCTSLSHLGLFSKGLPFNNGLICFERARILTRRDYN